MENNEIVIESVSVAYWYYSDDATGLVYAYPEDGSQDSYIGSNLRKMSAEEVAAHLNPQPRYWTDGITLMFSAASVILGMRLASQEEIEQLLPAMKLREAAEKISGLRKIADQAIAPLQDAVDIDEATPEEVAALKTWKKYRVALSRLPEQQGYPDEAVWPAAPS
ncbi:tail fiber assembly protein [Pseudomonas brassicacearum]|uniref:tail fiber assembly protein n=1 Tax=Pseudomonas brassicacearum TaxID=930166 RepID=UPI001F2106BC|nr:tail fiber assembly protein [Pseudomonas brassicacearum]